MLVEKQTDDFKQLLLFSNFVIRDRYHQSEIDIIKYGSLILTDLELNIIRKISTLFGLRKLPEPNVRFHAKARIVPDSGRLKEIELFFQNR